MSRLRVALCTPTRDRPHDAYLRALEGSAPLLEAAGIEIGVSYEVGCPYISGARATMLGKALVWKADVVVFIDDDVSWRPSDLLRLIQTEGEVVGGTYRFKRKDNEEDYMVWINTHGEPDFLPVVRESDGAISAYRLPGGFLKITRSAIDHFMNNYPGLTIKAKVEGQVDFPDLFNHGVINGVWYGEDMAFSMRWLDSGKEMWLVPDLELDHNGKDGAVWPGNFYEYMLRQPGGSKDPNRIQREENQWSEF